MSDATNGGRERAYQALRESEELHRATLSSISDAVFMADDHGAFTYVCPNVDMIFGYVPDEVYAMGRIGQLLGEDLIDRDALKAKGEIRNVEREVIAKSGEPRTVLIHLKQVAIQGGTVLCTCRDITERKLAERELAAVRIELAHAARLALVGELTASITHEIVQPLAAILVNASAGEDLAQDEKNRAEVVEIFRDIVHSCKHATQIIDRLRSLARKRPLELAPLDANEVVSEVMQLVAADAQRRATRLRTDLAPSPLGIDADRVSLQHVILNLIINAMDAMVQSDGDGRVVTLRTRESDGEVEIAVSDTGQGIAPEHLPKLFDPFFSTKPEGIGLGLAIARSIVEAHAGRIWAEQGDERGAVFRLALPARQAIS